MLKFFIITATFFDMLLLINSIHDGNILGVIISLMVLIELSLIMEDRFPEGF